MDIRVEILRHIVVNDVGNTLHVDTPSRDIRRDKHTIASILKSVEGLLSFALREVSVKRCHVLPLLGETLRKPLRGVLHLREDNHERALIIFEPVGKHLWLSFRCNLVERMSD